MTPEEIEALKADIKAKKEEALEKHQESRAKMADAKKLVNDIIAKAKAKEKAVKK